MKKLFLLLLISFCIKVNANHWTPNYGQFPTNMTITGIISIDGIEQAVDSLEIGAFCNDECRGSSIAHYESFFDRHFVFLMVHGDSNDSIHFRCYDHNRDMELEMICNTHIFFHSNDMLGGIAEPFVFSFESYKHNINIEVLPDYAGTVSGSGLYSQYDTCYLEITPNAGYTFDALIENNDTLTKQPYYSFIVMQERNIQAHFSELPTYYQVSAEANPNTGGSIEGAGQYLENDLCNLHITTNSGYDYLGLYENGELITEDTVFSFEVTDNRHFVAEFLLQPTFYEVSAEMFPENAGTITGLGAYQEGEICNLEITANTGYDFVVLTENNDTVTQETNYSFEVLADRHFAAHFELQEYTISLSAEPEEGGSVVGNGTYKYGETVYAIAIPDENYAFTKWTRDNITISTNSQYVFEATESVELVAHFEYTENIEEICEDNLTIYPNPASDYITIENIEKYPCEIRIYDMFGRNILNREINSYDNRVEISEIPQGTYILKINDDKRYSGIFVKRK